METGSGGVSVRAGPSARPSGRRAELRRAQRRHLRRAGAEVIPEEAALTGAHVCIECGRLGWPGGDPHRIGPQAALAPTRCDHCGHGSFIDLGLDSNALALRTVEDVGGLARRSSRKRVFRATMFGALVGLIVGFVPVWSLSVIVIIAGLCGLLTGSLMYLQERRTPGKSTSLPRRWSMALAPAGTLEGVASGKPSVTGDILRAPLTGRACVAYEIGVRFDDRGDGALQTWTLLEQRVAELELDGHTVDPRKTHLELTRSRLGTVPEAGLGDAALAYLRERGLRATEPGLVLFETIIEPWSEVELRRGSGGYVLSRTP